MVKFKTLKIGDHFEWGENTFKKLKTKMKNCCVPRYNSINIATEVKGYIPPHKMVTPIIIEDEE